MGGRRVEEMDKGVSQPDTRSQSYAWELRFRKKKGILYCTNSSADIVACPRDPGKHQYLCFLLRNWYTDGVIN